STGRNNPVSKLDADVNPSADVIRTFGGATSNARASVFTERPSVENTARSRYRPGGNCCTLITFEKMTRSGPAGCGGTSTSTMAGLSASFAISYSTLSASAPAPYASTYPWTPPNATSYPIVGCSSSPDSTGPPTISSLSFVAADASASAAWTVCSTDPTRSPSTTASFSVYSPGGRLAPAVYCSGDGTPGTTGSSRASNARLSTLRPAASVMTYASDVTFDVA